MHDCQTVVEAALAVCMCVFLLVILGHTKYLPPRRPAGGVCE